MSRQYKRKYALTMITTEGQSKTIDNLRIQFEVTKSIISTPNLAKITLFNANQDTLALLQAKYTQLILNAGYEASVGLIFKGEIRNVFQARQGIDMTTIIYAGDGQKAWDNSIFNKTFSENVEAQKIVQEVAQSFKEIVVGTLEGIPNIKDKLRGTTLSGASKDIMDVLAREYGFSWSIQDGALVTSSQDQPLSTTEAVVIEGATGMLGIPTVTETGAKVTTLLNPKLLPHAPFEIQATSAQIGLKNLAFRDPSTVRTSANGFYKTVEVVFSGDTRGNNWQSTATGWTL